MRFWLGTHVVPWLATETVPLFISAVRLRKKRKLPRAAGEWALDSGGFSAIKEHGCYRTSPQEYVAEVQRWSEEIGGMEWAAIQDWMCEPFMLEKTGRTLETHQQLTVNSWGMLNSIDGSLPWVPVLQGWTVHDYHRCADLYERHTATDLTQLPLVGLGSICRRQGTEEAAMIVKSLYARGFHNLHGFGFKTLGLTRRNSVAPYLKSSDSMAWSFRARRAWRHGQRKLCGGEHPGSCSNCRDWAMMWRERLLTRVERRTRYGTQSLLC